MLAGAHGRWGNGGLMYASFGNFTSTMSLVTALLLLPLILISCTRSATQPETAGSVVTFTDIASSSGITFRHTNGASGKYYFLETVASGGGFIDYDNDAKMER